MCKPAWCCTAAAGDVPRWVPLFSAFAVVSYTILDCLDGKQARRTGTSSPLGQLFDHGCDALSVNLLLASIACSLSMGCGWAHALGNLGVRTYVCISFMNCKGVTADAPVHCARSDSTD